MLSFMLWCVVGFQEVPSGLTFDAADPQSITVCYMPGGRNEWVIYDQCKTDRGVRLVLGPHDDCMQCDAPGCCLSLVRPAGHMEHPPRCSADNPDPVRCRLSDGMVAEPWPPRHNRKEIKRWSLRD